MKEEIEEIEKIIKQIKARDNLFNPLVSTIKYTEDEAYMDQLVRMDIALRIESLSENGQEELFTRSPRAREIMNEPNLHLLHKDLPK